MISEHLKSINTSSVDRLNLKWSDSVWIASSVDTMQVRKQSEEKAKVFGSAKKAVTTYIYIFIYILRTIIQKKVLT